MPAPAAPITLEQWAHIIGMVQDTSYGNHAADNAWLWLCRQPGHDMSFATFRRRLRAKRQEMQAAVPMVVAVPDEEGLPGTAAEEESTAEIVLLAASAMYEVVAPPTTAASATANFPAAEPLSAQTENDAQCTAHVSGQTPAACPACVRAGHRFVSNAPCYIVTDDADGPEVEARLCPACYVSREEMLRERGTSCHVAVLHGGDGAVMACLVRRRGERTAAEAMAHEELDASLRAAKLSPVQGGRQQHVYGAEYRGSRSGRRIDELIDATIAARRAGLNAAASKVIGQGLEGADVTVSYLEALRAQSLTDADMVTLQAPHVETQPPGGAQFIISAGARTLVQTLVYDVSGVAPERLAAAVQATPQQLACPRWRELMQLNHALLAAVCFCEPQPAFQGYLDAGDVLFLARGLVHCGQGLPVGAPSRVLVVGSGTANAVADEQLSQKQFMDAAAQNGLVRFLYWLCERDATLRGHLLTEHFLGRTRNRLPNGHPELTWTERQWQRFLECVRTRHPPSEELTNELIAQSRYVQHNNRGDCEPEEWLGPFRVQRGVPTAAPTHWHRWTLADSKDDAHADDPLAVTINLAGAGWHSEALQLTPASCRCTVTVMVTTPAGITTVLETLELGPNDRARIVPSAIRTGSVSITWKEHVRGQLAKTFMNYSVHGEEMDWNTARIECDSCKRQIVEPTWRYNAVELLDNCNACSPTDSNWSVASHETQGLDGGRLRLQLDQARKHELQEMLRARNLKTTGNKTELTERLEQANIAAAQLEQNRAY
jgi:hypothetical protein